MGKLSNLIFRQGWFFLALFVSLSLSPVGIAAAAATIGSLDIIDGSIMPVDLSQGAVTKAKLAANSVNSFKIQDGQISNADIASGAAIAAAKINRAGLNADLLDGVNSTAFLKKNTAAPQSMAGKLTAPNFAYSSAKTGAFTIPVVGANIVGPYSIYNSAAIVASGATAVDWYAPVHLPNGATITGLSYYAVTSADAQSTAVLYHWVTPVVSVTSSDHAFDWGLDSNSTITSGEEKFKDNESYHVQVHMNGGNGTGLQSGFVRINYTYTSPGN